MARAALELLRQQPDARLRVANDLRHRSFIGPIGNLIALAILFVSTPLFHDHPIATGLYIAVTAARILIRIVLTAAWRRAHASPPVFPAWMIATSVASLSLPTGLFAAFVVSQYGYESWSTLLVLSFAIVCATSGATAIAPDLTLAMIFESTLLLPIIVTGFWQGGAHGYEVAAALVVFTVYVTLQTIRLNSDYWNALAADLALQRRAEQLQAARAAADAANEAKSQFLANMSHEIRTPMNGVLGMLELALRTELSAEQREHLGDARESAQSLLVLLNDLLDHSKAEAGRLDLEEIAFDLPHLVEEALSPFALQARTKGIGLSCELANDVPRTLRGDPTRLRQVLVNLVSNAVKFTPSGSVAVSAKVEEVSGTNTTLRFTVTDTGPGIPADKLDSIFEAFSQGDGSITRRFGGTGLGLTICRDLVALMGGRIWADSRPGQGSAFHFTASLIRVADGSDAREVATGDPPPDPVRALRILVAEDNLINQKVLGKLLDRAGHTCEMVGTGAEAVERSSVAKFDLILMDVHMPEMDGREATRRIRAAQAHTAGHIPIVGVTASAAVRDLEECIAAGMDSCIAKPIVVADLETVLSCVTAGRLLPTLPARSRSTSSGR